jgi:phthalate 4,5-dioxygenase oxygenase subunit
MLTREDNELLTRVGSGTPMGELLRQYWIPFAQSFELPEPDGNSLRIRLLGEDLIAFRDSNDAVGLLANNCPHRGASLFFGRNEEAGLRCVYHGWKFDASGACVDMPNEPAESDFRTKVKAVAYPVAERNGVLWTYMGPRTTPPPLPDFEWAVLPASHRYVTPFVRECNWVQAMEGDIDSAHSSFLHSVLRKDLITDQGTGLKHQDRAPRFHVVDTDYGVMIGVQRTVDEDNYYWRLTQFALPMFTMFPPTGENADTVPGHIWIPIDDHNTLVWTLTWHPLRPLTEEEVATRGGRGNRRNDVRPFDAAEEYLPPTSQPFGAWRWVANKSNDFLLDYEAQRTRRFSGVPTIPLQDQAMTESMGPIMDRSAEHLGSTDAGIIRVRRHLLDLARALRERGVTPRGVDTPEVFAIRSASGILPREVPWQEATRDWTRARAGAPVVSA